MNAKQKKARIKRINNGPAERAKARLLAQQERAKIEKMKDTPLTAGADAW